jgi:hypothetical protein
MAITRLRSLSRTGSLAVLVADKSYNSLNMLDTRGNPILSVHGSVSIMVNMHAWGRCFELWARADSATANVMHTPQSCSALDVCFTILHKSHSSFTATRKIFEYCFGRVGLNDVFVLRDHIEDVVRWRHMSCKQKLLQQYVNPAQHAKQQEQVSLEDEQQHQSMHSMEYSGASSMDDKLSLESIVSIFRLSRWDIDVLWQFCDTIVTRLQSAHEANAAAEALSAALPHALRNYIRYFDPRGDQRNAYNRIAIQLGLFAIP